MEEHKYKKDDNERGSKDHIPDTTFIIVCGVLYVVSLLALMFG